MPRASHPELQREELATAVANLSRYLAASGVNFSISGGAAVALIRRHYGLRYRITDDIDLVVQPTATTNAEGISQWLLSTYPDAFVARELYGTLIPAFVLKRSDGSSVPIEIEIFDVQAWPQRPQYDLTNPDNEVATIPVGEVSVPVFSARWPLREKIVTAFERQGSRKARTDIEDAKVLLQAVPLNGLDMSGHKDAVQHMCEMIPDSKTELQLRVVCPDVFGQPWTWNDDAQVY